MSIDRSLKKLRHLLYLFFKLVKKFKFCLGLGTIKISRHIISEYKVQNKENNILYLVNDEVILPQIYSKGSYEPNTCEFFADLIQQESASVFVDIGANQGLIIRGISEILTSKKSPTKPKMIAIEPNPLFMYCLKLNTNNYNVISYVDAAIISNKSNLTVTELYNTKFNASASLNQDELYDDKGASLNNQKQVVLTINTNDLISSHLEVLKNKSIFIKIDIDGNDVEIMFELIILLKSFNLKNNLKAIQVEVNFKSHSLNSCIRDQLVSLVKSSKFSELDVKENVMRGQEMIRSLTENTLGQGNLRIIL